MNTEIFTCEMYLCDNQITPDPSEETDGVYNAINGPYAPELGRDLFICYDCEEQLSISAPPDRIIWIANSEVELTGE